MVVDLKLIKVFITIFDTKSVSLAAERLNITQPSVSHSLSRLRYLMKDQLFTRTREGMIPTFHATQLYDSLNQPLLDIENVINEVKEFDFRNSNRCFRIALTDIGGMYFLPLILSSLEKIAPNIAVEVITVDMKKLSDWLITGKIDAAICNKNLEDSSLNTFTLFREKYVCLVSKNIKSVKDILTLDNFLQENHAIVSASTGHNLIESYLSKQGLRRKIKLRVPQFSILDELIEKHNLIVTVPSRVDAYFKYNPSIRIFDVPFELPEFDVTLHWHEKKGHVLAQKWFINFLNDTLSNL
ncbi:LysR family transcriptional regulator [Psychrobacter sp. CCUG 69069]|jgi:DNA-binding transcriptional LysR family regulator|nr:MULTISPECIES: LysR family transcriptional regulator [unclassified Psychrobacter]MCD1278282.1 LysR family transcriptional regulator [Psychrobacter sp. CCUG 69069]PKH55033.1 LysR family transcriptional regulator [Psychrobacter sp. Choline-02u-9]|tara:strand:- start:6284 stop:7177 length:894 start_codon:yes stop_codon:yes gene_type:complete